MAIEVHLAHIVAEIHTRSAAFRILRRELADHRLGRALGVTVKIEGKAHAFTHLPGAELLSREGRDLGLDPGLAQGGGQPIVRDLSRR